MQVETETASVSRAEKIAGRVLSAAVILVLLLVSAMDLVKPKSVVDGTTKMGYSEGVIVPLGIVLGISTILYAIPRTSVLGAILLTGYFGGAVATHVHAGQGPNIFAIPILFGVALWLGLVLRDGRLRLHLPVRR
jgi:hypothetical protein